MTVRPYIIRWIGTGVSRRAQLSTGRYVTTREAQRGAYADHSGMQYGVGPSNASRAPIGASRPAGIGATASARASGGALINRPLAPVTGSHAPTETRATQTFLKNQGYNVTVDGVWGPLTQSAAANWRSTNRNPAAWTASNQPQRPGVTPPHPAVPGSRTPAATTPGIASRTPSGTPTAGGGSGSIGGLLGLSNAVPGIQRINPGLANFGTMLDPHMADVPAGAHINPADYAHIGNPFSADMADRLAGQQFDASITEAQRQVSQTQIDTAGAVGDVRNWYGQVEASQADAAKQDKVIGAAGVQSAQETGAGILSSLGGGANPGSAVVGAQTASDTNTLSALSANEQQYNADAAPILKLESASAATQQQNIGDRATADARARVIDLQAQRGGAASQLAFQIAQYNNTLANQQADRTLQIQQYNTRLDTAAQGNRIGIVGANNSLAQSRATIRLGIISNNQAGVQQGFANRATMEGIGIARAQLGQGQQNININAATAAAGISNQRRITQIQAAQAGLSTNRAAQQAQATGLQSGVASHAFDAQLRVHPGGIPAAVSAIKATTVGLPIAMAKQVMHTNLLRLKNMAGQHLFTEATIQRLIAQAF